LKRKQTVRPGRTIIYGVHPVIETLKAGRRQVQEVYLARDPSPHWGLDAVLEAAEIPLTRVSPNELITITGSSNHQGLAALVGPFPYIELFDLLSASADQPGPILILDEIQDPANLGSILRSGECLGAVAVVLSKDRSVAVTPAVEKTSAGAAAHVPLARVVNLVRAMNELKESGYWIYATDSRARDVCFVTDLTGRLAFVLGSEGKGIRRLVREKCDAALSIPMAGLVGSLNVSQTAAILLAEALRQRLAMQR
jgi:23S rRNA (guanosine2251-2'-O)-methyltransferase